MKANQSSSVINLESLIDLSARLIELADTGKILRSAALSLIGKLKFTRFGIFYDQDGKFKHADSDLQFKRRKIKDFEKIINTDESSCRLLGLGYEYCLPVFYKSEIYAVICFGKRFVDDDLSDEELKYARLVASIAANSVENSINLKGLQEQQKKLHKRNQLLRTLFEISNDFNTLLSADDILKMLSFHLMGQVAVTRFAIVMQNNSGKMNVLINRFNGDLSEICLERTSKIEKTVNTENNENSIFKENPEVKLVIPMKLQSRLKGVLLIGKKYSGRDYDDHEISFLESLANVAVSALENERLVKEEIEKQQLESELSFAREIQQDLLPEHEPAAEGFDIAGLSYPSRDVGGDYYDFIEKEDNIYVCIADVSGKGMPASLIMANFQAALRIVADYDDNLEKIVQKLNRIVYENTSPDKFITLFIGILDKTTGLMEYINAGHNAPLFISGNTVEELEIGGMLLGVLEDCDDYEKGEITFKENDLLFMFTDGVNEAENKAKEDFGNARLINTLSKLNRNSSRNILEGILSDVSDHTDGAPQYDDITMIAVKRNKLS